MATKPDKAVKVSQKHLLGIQDLSISDVKYILSEAKQFINLNRSKNKKLNTLRAQLDKLQAIGGVNSIVPSEGIVFKYNGKTYKFTGAFAPINQITGLISF